MQLYLHSYGCFLGVKDGLFLVKRRDSPAEVFAPRVLQSIMLSKSVRVTSNALFLALEQQIPLLFIDRVGHCVGRLWNGKFGSIVSIRKQQCLFAMSSEGMQWIAALLIQKIENQIAFVQEFVQAAVVANARAFFVYKVELMQRAKQRFVQAVMPQAMELEKMAASFRGWEGGASRAYFEALSAQLPGAYRFKARSRRPALNAFNALLNYLYGMLYNEVELALVQTGLDPYIGILHTDRHNHPTLVYDFIDAYRIWAERCAVEICARGALRADGVEQLGKKKGFFLTWAGKQVVIPRFIAYLEEEVWYRSLWRKRRTHLRLDAQKLATYLKESYKIQDND